MAAVRAASILFGRCMETSRVKGVEVSVKMMELDTYLNMFFNERYTFYAYDAHEQCKVGDLILIKKLEQPMTRKITHEVLKVIYPMGDVTDPVTGKRVVVDQYREHMEELDEMYTSKARGGFTRYIRGKRQQLAAGANSNENDKQI